VSFERPIIHLVDDDPSFLKAIRRLLEVSGYTVHAFSTAEEFLKCRKPHVRGCIVLDLQMPGLSGLDLQGELARARNPLPIIFLTAYGDIPSSVRAMKSGADDFLTKPIKKDALLNAVQVALLRDAEAFTRRIRLDHLRERFNSLTQREREVLELVLSGKLNKEIAWELGTTERTIKAHRAKLMEKLDAQTPAELGRLAQEVSFKLAPDSWTFAAAH
jgi:FixJ family two-component response regulator